MENQEQEEKVTTRSIGIKFGLYNALVGILLFAIAVVMNMNPFSGVMNWVGAAIGIGLIVFAHIQFKANGDGYMSFGEGVGIAFWIGLISTVITIPLMYVYLNFVDNSPMELMFQQQEEKMIEGGAPEEAIEMGLKWTKMLFWPFAAIGGIFWSVLSGLIVSIFTKKSRPEMPI
jgi:hypothetical protein